MKKKSIMVHYRLVPSDEYNNNNTVLHSSSKCLCLKLTRFRLVGFIIVVILSMIILLMAFLSSASWNPHGFMNTTKAFCIDATPDIAAGLDQNKNQSSKSGLLKQRLPTVIIIGARKAGTRALIQFISLHKDIVAAKKETHYFDRNYNKDMDWYRQKMPFSLPHQITIEKTPSYFVDEAVPENIYQYNSSIKLLLIVRNPIDRAMSDYIQLKGKANTDIHPESRASFEEMVISQFSSEINESYLPIKRSLYARYIDNWLRVFPLNQILILDGENIKIRPWDEISKVERFLGLSQDIPKSRFIFNQTKGFYCIRSKFHNTTVLTENRSYHVDSVSNVPYVEKCLAKSKGREHPAIQPDVRLKLAKFFKPHNKRFFDRIKQRFDWY